MRMRIGRAECTQSRTKSKIQPMFAGKIRGVFSIASQGVVLGALLLLLAGAGERHALGQSENAAQQSAPRPPGQNPNGMHIYLWAGLKSHLPGQHDYPQFLADWSKLLTEHGAVVDGALHPPSAADLEHTDVLVIYKGDAGYPIISDRAALEAYVKRGSGLVQFHDSLCGP
jgi:hypothetical protein